MSASHMMTNRIVTSLFTITLAVGAFGCKSDEDKAKDALAAAMKGLGSATKNLGSAAKPTVTPTVTPAVKPAVTATATTGIPECDAYLATYDKWKACDAAPADSGAGMERANILKWTGGIAALPAAEQEAEKAKNRDGCVKAEAKLKAGITTGGC